jgi:hypothetical protein
MKKIIITLTIFINAVVAVYAQSTKKSVEEINCYLKWAQKFEIRGAEDVADGSYADVIITFRNGSEADCFNGKCDVKDGKIIAIYTKLEDGTFELVKKKFKSGFPATITNGMSNTVLTLENELINVLFVKKIKPKKATPQKAADPSED